MTTQALIAATPGLDWSTDPALVRQKSRDFFWYSPILKRQLNRVTAEALVTPRDEPELIAVLAAAHAHGVPLTPRGAGTGNYGQAMPLRGGVVVDLSGLNRIIHASPHVLRVQAGANLTAIEAQTRPTHGAELRFHPSTRRTATIGGFVAGGSAGVGSITYGTLREPGNVLALRVLTCEAEPRAVELRGPDVHPAIHAYGTNGIITEVEIPLAPAHPWVDVAASFPTLAAACRFADAFAGMDGIARKLATVVNAPIAQDYFRTFGARVPAGHAVAMLMVAAPFLETVLPLLAGAGGTVVHQVATDDAEIPLYEHSWNHTTLQALKVDRSLTYLQTLFPAPDHLARIARMASLLGDEAPMHMEFVHLSGQVCAFGLQLVRFTTEARLREIIALHESEGCPIFDPHVFSLEEGGMKRVDAAQLLFKREADPKGLLNPGKMLAWDQPDWQPGRPQSAHLFETDAVAPAEALE